MSNVPRLVSADDHILEPPHLWSDRLPSRYREIGPRVVREKVPSYRQRTKAFRAEGAQGSSSFVFDGSGAASDAADAATGTEDWEWADVWYYEDSRYPVLLASAAVGYPHDEIDFRTTTFDDIRPGCFDPKARLADMDIAGIEASVCFPNSSPTRFCGQGFLEAKDRDLALLCVEAYNDFILDEWCAGSGGRLIPCGIIPMWDAHLAAEEVQRLAARGNRAICFSEAPAYLGLPSIHSGEWDPLFAACADTETVLMIHVGSSSHVPLPAPDSPLSLGPVLITANAAAAMCDWLFSGLFDRYPALKICLAECQIGWIPYYLQQCDEIWESKGFVGDDAEKVQRPPSTYFTSNVYVTFFDDLYGLKNLDLVGASNVLVEADYPHAASTWPTTHDLITEQVRAAKLDDQAIALITNQNARRLFRLG